MSTSSQYLNATLPGGRSKSETWYCPTCQYIIIANAASENWQWFSTNLERLISGRNVARLRLSSPNFHHLSSRPWNASRSLYNLDHVLFALQTPHSIVTVICPFDFTPQPPLIPLQFRAPSRCASAYSYITIDEEVLDFRAQVRCCWISLCNDIYLNKGLMNVVCTDSPGKYWKCVLGEVEAWGLTVKNCKFLAWWNCRKNN